MNKILSALCAAAMACMPLLAQQKVEITANNVRFRTAPSTTNSEVLGQLNKGDILTFKRHESDGKWIRVTNDEGILGYVSSQYARVIGEPAAPTPTASTIATPTADTTADGQASTTDEAPDAVTAATAPTAKAGTPIVPPFRMTTHKEGNKTYNVADINDVSKVYRPNAVKANCFFVISKQEFRLYVYEKVGTDTLLAAHYPVCYAKYPEGKTKTGDMRTPDCTIAHPFRISQIQNASSWAHDFKDGRGSFPAYGAWFMRLDLSKSDCAAGCRSNRSIGIHGSTGNAASVPGRDSEGCIRLRDADIKDLKERFSQVGTPVVVKAVNVGKYPFERRAQQKCSGYVQPTAGYKKY